jgi:hypothetical protein
MRKFIISLTFLLFMAPLIAAAGVNRDDLPPSSTWYFHADFDSMRSSDAGSDLYGWIETEVFGDIRDETGVDLSKEADRITAYATADDGAVLVLEGELTQDTRDKALAAAATAEKFDILEKGRWTYYRVVGDGSYETRDLAVDGLGDELYFSFALKDRVVMATKEQQLLALLEGGGRIAGSRGHDGALFVLTAEKSLLQAGMSTDRFADDDGGFDSNILRNTKQIALMVADVAGNIAIEAQLLAAEPKMAESLASIVRGLIALQAFSEDMDPDIAGLLNGTRVDVDANLLKISVAITPDSLKTILDEA